MKSIIYSGNLKKLIKLPIAEETFKQAKRKPGEYETIFVSYISNRGLI